MGIPSMTPTAPMGTAAPAQQAPAAMPQPVPSAPLGNRTTPPPQGGGALPQMMPAQGTQQYHAMMQQARGVAVRPQAQPPVQAPAGMPGMPAPAPGGMPLMMPAQGTPAMAQQLALAALQAKQQQQAAHAHAQVQQQQQVAAALAARPAMMPVQQPSSAVGIPAAPPAAAATTPTMPTSSLPQMIPSAAGSVAPAPAMAPLGTQAPAQAHKPPAPSFAMPPPPVPKKRAPVTEDDRRVVSRRGLAYALKASGLDPSHKLDPSVEGCLMELYEEMIGNAISFGCNNVKRRQGSSLKPRDMAVYLERVWGLCVPGFNTDQLRPYRRAAPSELHRARIKAARQSAASMEASGEGGAAGGAGTSEAAAAREGAAS